MRKFAHSSEPDSPNPEGAIPGPTPTRFGDRVPWQELTVYSAGVLAAQLAWSINTLTNPIFNVELGVNVAWLSTALAILRIIDSFTDVGMAHITDNFVSRFGRRRPFVVVGGILMGLVFAAFWMFPRGWSEQAYLAWYVGMSFVLYLTTTMFGTSYFALGIELTPDYRERTRVMSVRSYFQKFSGLILPWLYPITQLGIFVDAIEGMRWVGAIVGGAIIAFSVPAGIFTRERFIRQVKTTEPIPFLMALRVTFRNEYFWMLLGVSLALGAALALFEQLGFYINVFYVFSGDRAMGSAFGAIGGSIATVLAILAVPLIWWMCNKFGKHNTLRIALCWMFVGSILKWYLFTPGNPYLQFVLPFFYSLGISSVFLVLATMQPDVIDIDEMRTGRRREAMFSSISNWVNKLALSGAVALSGYIINWTGFDLERAGNQSESTFFWMRFCFSFASAVFILLSLLCLVRYDLTETRMQQLRTELEDRRGKANSATAE